MKIIVALVVKLTLVTFLENPAYATTRIVQTMKSHQSLLLIALKTDPLKTAKIKAVEAIVVDSAEVVTDMVTMIVIVWLQLR